MATKTVKHKHHAQAHGGGGDGYVAGAVAAVGAGRFVPAMMGLTTATAPAEHHILRYVFLSRSAPAAKPKSCQVDTESTNSTKSYATNTLQGGRAGVVAEPWLVWLCENYIWLLEALSENGAVVRSRSQVEIMSARHEVGKAWIAWMAAHSQAHLATLRGSHRQRENTGGIHHSKKVARPVKLHDLGALG